MNGRPFSLSCSYANIHKYIHSLKIETFFFWNKSIARHSFMHLLDIVWTIVIIVAADIILLLLLLLFDVSVFDFHHLLRFVYSGIC